MVDTLTSPDLAARLRAEWADMSDDQRQLVIDLVWTLGGPDSALMDVIDDLEGVRAFADAMQDREQGRPFEEVIVEIEGTG